MSRDVVGGGGRGPRSQTHLTCNLLLPLTLHVALVRLYNFLSHGFLFKHYYFEAISNLQETCMSSTNFFLNL